MNLRERLLLKLADGGACMPHVPVAQGHLTSDTASLEITGSLSMADLFPAANPESIFEDEVEQTYEDFEEIGKRNPNKKGTGRYKLCKGRDRIAVYYFGSSRNVPKNLDLYLGYLSDFLLLEVDYFERFDALDPNTNTFTLNGQEYDVPIEPLRGCKVGATKRKKAKVESKLDVFSLFDVLVHVAKKPYFSVLGLFDCTLVEEDQEVLGRACGNRVCCISLLSCDSLPCLIATSCHELLHTMGFDHNTSERCVMNAIGSEDWLFLSRTNLRKLQLFHEEGMKLSGVNTKYRSEGFDEFLLIYHDQLLARLSSDSSIKSLGPSMAWLRSLIKTLSLSL